MSDESTLVLDDVTLLLVEGRAVEIDPDYVNAWLKLKAVEVKRDAKEADLITLNLMRLGKYDPNSSESELTEDACDLAKLWDAILQKDAEWTAPASGPIYRLAASKGEMNFSRRAAPDRPRDKFTSHGTVKMLIALMNGMKPRTH